MLLKEYFVFETLRSACPAKANFVHISRESGDAEHCRQSKLKVKLF
jgi:hypothetical protein